MKKEDLIELLTEITECDAIVGMLYHYFHTIRKYDVKLLDDIIMLGVSAKHFVIGDIEDYSIKYEKIVWVNDNYFQEVIPFDVWEKGRQPQEKKVNDRKKFMYYLFRNDPIIPPEFEQFLTE